MPVKLEFLMVFHSQKMDALIGYEQTTWIRTTEVSHGVPPLQTMSSQYSIRSLQR
jgi:hypothetical protein